MSVSNARKTINKDTLDCSEKALVTLSFDAKSELVGRPADIILIMDRSSSLVGERMDEAKKGAVSLINLVSEASGGEIGQSIGNNSRMGIISFSGSARKDLELTNDAANLINTINSIKPGGSTNHEDAFIKASELIDEQSTNDKIFVMFTDGVTTGGGDPNVQAELLKAKGVEIYCIGLGDDSTLIESWASKPVSKHVANTNDLTKLNDIFKIIAYEVIKVGARNALLIEKLNNNFKILKIVEATPGIAELKDLQTIEWNMDAVGIGENDVATLSFEIQYIGTTNQTINVNDSVIYNDRDGGKLTFPNPVVNVTCNSTIIIPDSCQNATSIEIEGCKDASNLTVLETTVQDLGRIVQVDVPINNVCPNKRLGLAVILTEIDSDGIEHNRGMKTVLIKPIDSEKCENILVKCINFVVPEVLDVVGSQDSLCNTRIFKARALVNYIDTNFICCDAETVIVE